MHIGFLYNHDQPHQIAHSLPIAMSLSSIDPDIKVELIASNEVVAGHIRAFARPEMLFGVTVTVLAGQRLSSRLFSRVANRFVPYDKFAFYGENLPYLSKFDALVVTEKTSLRLKTKFNLQSPLLIHTRHGAGDRAIGFGKESALFDLVLVSGQKIRNRLISEAGVVEKNIAVVGYPRFDLPPGQFQNRFPDPTKPIVLYNPHPSPHLSSWYKAGRDILEYFYQSGDYNLIFAPHVMLFHRRIVFSIDKLAFAIPGKIDAKYINCPHMLVDTGSIASSTMTYTHAADIYLGDVSSQVYEFLIRPRPCVFFDAQQTRYHDDPNFKHWSAGQVVDSIAGLDMALATSSEMHQSYLSIQKAIFDQTFALTDVTSSVRAAQAIVARLRSGNGTQSEKVGF